MEVSAGIVVFRPIPSFSVAGVSNTHHLHHSSSKAKLIGFSSVVAANRFSSNKVSVPPPSPPRIIFFGISSSAFSDSGHLNYYHVHAPVRCGGKKEKINYDKVKENGSSGVVVTTTKKKLKLLKGLSKDLSMFSDMAGFGVDPYSGLVGQVQGKIVSEAADALMRQLQQVRAEEKELKRKKKLEKAQLKVRRMRTMIDSESSSSSGSSDSECRREVLQMSRLRKQAFVQPIVHELQLQADAQQELTSTTLPTSLTQEGNTSNKETRFEDRYKGNLQIECCSGSISTTENLKVESCSGSSTTCSSNVVCNDGNSLVVAGASAKRIEVCMGGKCKKSGGAELLDEFERAIGVEGAVVGCKCMGKCKDGPNVRVLNCLDGVEADGVDDSVRTPTNPLCIGVSLADVGVILANFFGEDGGLAPAV